MGQEWTGGDIARYAGGGMKVNLLKAALEKHKDKSNLIIMFVDRYKIKLIGHLIYPTTVILQMF